jgi:hypothetical protein
VKRLVLVTLLVVAIVAIPSVPASAGGGQNTFRVDKVVTGNGPDASTEFEFEVDCGGQVTELSIEAGGSDAVGAGVVTCTVVETENRGATNVSYSCSTGGGAVCGDDGASVQFPESQSTLTATITVTNDFGGTGGSSTTTTDPSTTTTTAAGASPAAAVVATPAFTG